MTLEAFLAMPETKPASEFINGQVIQKPMPQGKHSCLQGQFAKVISDFIGPNKVAYAFLELQCICGTSAVVPDIPMPDFMGKPSYTIEELFNLLKA